MSQPERYQQGAQNAVGASYAVSGSLYSGAATGPSARLGDYDLQKETPSIPALHLVGQRLENLVCRLADANINSRVFVERVVGGRPDVVKADNGVAGQSPVIMQAITDLLNQLERRVADAEHLSRELGRIG